MNEEEFDPDGIRVFIPESKEAEELRLRQKSYEEHLKKVRKMISRALVVFVFICWLFSQNGRYQPNSTNNDLIIDTRNGVSFDYTGTWMGSDDKKIVKIKRVEMGFWPYFGFWKLMSEEK